MAQVIVWVNEVPSNTSDSSFTSEIILEDDQVGLELDNFDLFNLPSPAFSSFLPIATPQKSLTSPQDPDYIPNFIIIPSTTSNTVAFKPTTTDDTGRHRSGRGGGAGRAKSKKYHWYASRYLCSLTLLVILLYSIKHFSHVLKRNRQVQKLGTRRKNKIIIARDSVNHITPTQLHEEEAEQFLPSNECLRQSNDPHRSPTTLPSQISTHPFTSVHQSPKSIFQRAHAASRSATQTYLYLRNFPKWLYGPDTVADALCTIVYCGLLFFYSLNKTKWVGGDGNAPNQMGVMAFSQLPLILLLVTKNNPISSLTGITYQKLNYLHRASSRACLLLSWVHAIAWTPEVWEDGHFSHMYIITGLFALFGFTLLWVTSFRIVRRVAYEFFIVSHIFFTFVFLIGAIFHWVYLSYWVWLSLAIWLIDRLVRFIRLSIQNKPYFSHSLFNLTTASSTSTFLTRQSHSQHRGYKTRLLAPQYATSGEEDAGDDSESALSFDMSPSRRGRADGEVARERSEDWVRVGVTEDDDDEDGDEDRNNMSWAKIELVDQDLIRITAKVGFSWSAGQHVFISAPSVQSSVHESHPFSIANIPASHNGRAILLVRVHSGFTRRLRDALPSSTTRTIPILFEGPYGATHSIPTTLPHLSRLSFPTSPLTSTSVLLLAGGTGVTFTSSHLLALLHDSCMAAGKDNPASPSKHAGTPLVGKNGAGVGVKRIRLVWHVRKIECVRWLSIVINAAAEMMRNCASALRDDSSKTSQQNSQSKSDSHIIGLDLKFEIYITRAHVADEPAPEPSLAEVVFHDFAAITTSSTEATTTTTRPTSNRQETSLNPRNMRRYFDDNLPSALTSIAPSTATSARGSILSFSSEYIQEEIEPDEERDGSAGASLSNTVATLAVLGQRVKDDDDEEGEDKAVNLIMDEWDVDNNEIDQRSANDDDNDNDDDKVNETTSLLVNKPTQQEPTSSPLSIDTTSHISSESKSRGKRHTARHVRINSQSQSQYHSHFLPQEQLECPHGQTRGPRKIPSPRDMKSFGLSEIAAPYVSFFAGRADLKSTMRSDLMDSEQLSVAVCGPIELIRAARVAVSEVDNPFSAWQGQGKIEYFEETLGV